MIDIGIGLPVDDVSGQSSNLKYLPRLTSSDYVFTASIGPAREVVRIKKIKILLEVELGIEAVW